MTEFNMSTEKGITMNIEPTYKEKMITNLEGYRD